MSYRIDYIYAPIYITLTSLEYLAGFRSVMDCFRMEKAIQINVSKFGLSNLNMLIELSELQVQIAFCYIEKRNIVFRGKYASIRAFARYTLVHIHVLSILENSDSICFIGVMY